MEITEDGRSVARYAGVDLREVGDWEAGEVVVEASTPLRDHLRAPGGGLRTGALIMLCDNVGGFCGGLAALPDGWVVTTNITLTVTPARAVGPLSLRSTVLRSGRSAIVTDVRVHDLGRDAVIGDAVVTSAVLVPEGGPPHWDRPAHLHAPPPAGALPAVVEWLGLHDVAGESPGVVEFDVTDTLRNPWGIVHGGVTASLVDVAAERAGAAWFAAPAETGDVVLHYLSPARVGPVRAIATVLGARPDGVVARVEVHDTGNADRVVARATATVRPR